jgi:hypothetical protein
MNRVLPVVACLAGIVLSPGASGQSNASQIINLPSCSMSERSGHRIVSMLEIVEFYAPRFASFTKMADADYVEYVVRYGPKQDNLRLKFMFGHMVGGHDTIDSGSASIQWTETKWGCHADEDGTDLRGVSDDGRRWRIIKVPFGFAAYEAVPPKAADYFDKILNTMCCGKCPFCKK